MPSLEIVEGTLTLSDGKQIQLGGEVVTLNTDPQERLRCWEMEYRTDSQFLHKFGELTHIPQRIELCSSGGQCWYGRTLISSNPPDRVDFIGYGPLERKA